jgi:hypothetical protein
MLFFRSGTTPNPASNKTGGQIRNAVKDNCTEDAVVDNCLRFYPVFIKRKIMRSYTKKMLSYNTPKYGFIFWVSFYSMIILNWSSNPITLFWLFVVYICCKYFGIGITLNPPISACGCPIIQIRWPICASCWQQHALSNWLFMVTDVLETKSNKLSPLVDLLRVQMRPQLFWT